MRTILSDRLQTCSSMVQPISLSSGQRAMDSMAAVATSAALPWMGVLIAARKACPCHSTHPSAIMLPEQSPGMTKINAQNQYWRDTLYSLQLEPC